MMQTSPGSMSRISFAPTAFSAQVSDATTYPLPFNRPTQSGCSPWGSRAAINSLSVITTSEYAPLSCAMTVVIASSTGAWNANSRCSNFAMISLSDVA